MIFAKLSLKKLLLYPDRKFEPIYLRSKENLKSKSPLIGKVKVMVKVKYRVRRPLGRVCVWKLQPDV